MERQTDIPINESPLDWDIKQPRTKRLKIECNLCGRVFKPQNKYERFCQSCKDEAEEYLLYDDSSVFY